MPKKRRGCSGYLSILSLVPAWMTGGSWSITRTESGDRTIESRHGGADRKVHQAFRSLSQGIALRSGRLDPHPQSGRDDVSLLLWVLDTATYLEDCCKMTEWGSHYSPFLLQIMDCPSLVVIYSSMILSLSLSFCSIQFSSHHPPARISQIPVISVHIHNPPAASTALGLQ